MFSHHYQGFFKQGNRHPRASARSVVHAGTTTEHLTEIYLPSAKLAASQHCVWAFGSDNPITASSSFGLRPKSKWPTLIAGNLTCTLWMPLEIGSKLFPHNLNSMLIAYTYDGQKSMRAPNHWFHTPAVGKSLSNVPKPWSHTPAVGICLQHGAKHSLWCCHMTLGVLYHLFWPLIDLKSP